MDITELSKVANNGETALAYAAWEDLDKLCELLINRMSIQLLIMLIITAIRL
ncbi:hypothetical protein RAS_14450 [Rickettsia asiatica]|uniref:Uncharacterized protein n=1 Tax=Rickettsia asiatica TaxID=238800 RepID=A0A510G934_9RICK|nr:hypothetical protein [Rickettsia asiatica]BBJ32336.1 hypothetical protein RAS_14450 [Rickettsia asiatica]